jgi:hypothetical protein
MDLRLEDSEALPVAADINARYPWIQVILLSEQEDYTLLKRYYPRVKGRKIVKYSASTVKCATICTLFHPFLKVLSLRVC